MAQPGKKVVVSKQEIGRRLQAIRQSRGLTQAKLARRLRTLQSNISDIERGARKPTLQQLVDLSRILHVSIDEILTSEKGPAEDGLIKDRRFLRRLHKIDKLSRRDKQSLLGTIDAFLSKVS